MKWAPCIGAPVANNLDHYDFAAGQPMLPLPTVGPPAPTDTLNHLTMYYEILVELIDHLEWYMRNTDATEEMVHASVAGQCRRIGQTDSLTSTMHRPTSTIAPTIVADHFEIPSRNESVALPAANATLTETAGAQTAQQIQRRAANIH